MKKTSIAKATRKVAQEMIEIDSDVNKNLIDTFTETWDDLTKMKDELAHSVIDFIQQVHSIIDNPTVQQVIGDRKSELDKLYNVFRSDIEEISSRIAGICVKHESKSGRMTSLEEMTEYSRIFMEYQTIFTELQALLTPTLSSMVLLIDEVSPKQEQVVQQES